MQTRELWKLLWTLIKRPKKPLTAKQKAARSAAAKKAAAKRAANKKAGIKSTKKAPSPRSHKPVAPGKPGSPRRATVAA